MIKGLLLGSPFYVIYFAVVQIFLFYIQLTINGYRTYYWESDRGAEIDFIIQRDGKLIPIEVKSADNTKAKSLKVYMDAYKPDYAIKLSAKNFAFEDNKKIVPLYAAFCI